jgi:dTDP-4-amino-4,6-dideoxygalactose transaminase
VGVLSFGGSKLLTAGRGGALLTRQPELLQRARLALTRAGNLVCPLSELQAIVLEPQLDLLPARNVRRAQNVAQLSERLRGVPGLRPFRNRVAESEPGYYKLGFQLDEKMFGLPRSRFVAALQAEGVAFDEGFRALHVGRSPSRFRAAGELREAERAHAGTVVLHHPVLLGPSQQIDAVAEAVWKIQRADWRTGRAL